jgi:cysteine-rich repeat protein
MPSDAAAMCDVIPGSTKEFRGALGSLNRPFAIPGDHGQALIIALDRAGCDHASPGFPDQSTGRTSEDDIFITLLFKPPAGGARNAVILTTQANEILCQSRTSDALSNLGDDGNASCRTVSSGTQELNVIDSATLAFRFPDTDAQLALSDDDLTLAGPAVIAVTSTANALPFELANRRCADATGLIACIDEFYDRDATCDSESENTDLIFSHFTALPPANDYQALCSTPNTECTNTGEPIRLTIDAKGNALIPIDWRGVLVNVRGNPVPRLVRGVIQIQAFPGGPLFSDPGSSFLGAYSTGGHALPPLLESLANLDSPNSLTLYGSADWEIGVLRVARRIPSFTGSEPIFGQCSGGLNDLRPCVVDRDCRGGVCGETTCHLDESDTELVCANDADCSDRTVCGPSLFDFSTRLESGVGPVLVAPGNYSLDAEAPVPPEGILGSEETLAFVELESIAGRDPETGARVGLDLNGDGDHTDPVVVIRSRATGSVLPIGVANSPGRASARISGDRFSFPAVSVDRDLIAFLEPEPLQGDCSDASACDTTHDGDVADTILRVFRSENDRATEITGGPGPIALCGDALPVIDGKPIAISDGLVFFRRPEAGCARHTTQVLSVTSEGVTAAGSLRGLSDEGTIALIESSVPGMVPEKTTARSDAFIRDLTTNSTTWVSFGEAADGMRVEADQPVVTPHLSGDGNWVVFSTRATNIVRGIPDDGQMRTFVHDRLSGETGLLTPSHAQLDPNSDLFAEGISDFGRFVMLRSGAVRPSEAPVGPDPVPHLFLYDLDTGRTDVLDVNDAGTVSSTGIFPEGELSAALDPTGRSALFQSLARNLADVDDDIASFGQIYLRRPDLSTTELVSVSSRGEPSIGFSVGSALAVSRSQRFALFASLAPNLVAGDTNDDLDYFVRDLESGTTKRINLGVAGRQGTREESQIQLSGGALSEDGRYAAFISDQLNLVTDVRTEANRVYLRDRVSGLTQNLGSAEPGIVKLSDSGDIVAFNRFDEAVVRTPLAATQDLNLDGDALDTVLAVLDTDSNSVDLVTLAPAGQAAIRSGIAAYLAREHEAHLDLNGDLDFRDEVVQLYFHRPDRIDINLGRAAVELALSDGWVAALISEEGEGADLNGDQDVADWVVSMVPADQRSSRQSWFDTGLAASAVGIAGDWIAFLTPEASQGAVDLNGDGDFVDHVIQVVNAPTGELFSIGQAAEDFVSSGDLVAFRTRESAQGGSDLNGDGDKEDYVLQVYDLRSGYLFNSGQAAVPCEFEICDPRTPYRINGDIVTFLTLEAQQSEDLNSDGDMDDIVLQTFNASEAAHQALSEQLDAAPRSPSFTINARDCVDSIAGVSAGVCTTTAVPCATSSECGSGACYVPPGGCIAPRDGTCTCGPARCTGCNDGEFCLPLGDGSGECYAQEGACTSRADCGPGASCREKAETIFRLQSPFASHKDGTQTVATADLRPTKTGRECTSNTNCLDDPETVCSEGGTCEPFRLRLVVAGARDSDSDGIIDPRDNCPKTPNAKQTDGDADGVGDECDEGICGDGRRDLGEECDGSDDCRADCQLERPPTICGDGVLGDGEECDLGEAGIAGDCCAPDCQFASVGTPCSDGDRCSQDDSCGLGGACLPGAPTNCDDGHSCTANTCEPETGCHFIPIQASCDDGDPCTTDTCDLDSGCVNEPVPLCEAPTCGDGEIEIGEECDDLNLGDGDGCSSSCREEPGYSCDGRPSRCSRATDSLLEVDRLVPGDRLVTRDLDTRLDWLDPVLTAGLSHTDIEEGVGSWSQEGWRHATAVETCALLRKLGPTPSPCPSSIGEILSGDVAPHQRFLGVTEDLGSTRITSAVFADANFVDVRVGLVRLVDSAQSSHVSVRSDSEDPAIGTPGIGHLLVREVPVGCGNGIREVGELCDDGNSLDRDGCTLGCTRDPYSHDDFESDGLANWTLGGRRDGTFFARIEPWQGSAGVHLYHASFTELTLSRTLEFERAIIGFDMDIAVSSTTPPAPHFYASAGVSIRFRNAASEHLGRVDYLKATTPFPFDTARLDPNSSFHEVPDGGPRRYSLYTTELLSEIDIDPNDVSTIEFVIFSYGSTYPTPSVAGHVWFDNFSVTEPIVQRCGDGLLESGEGCDDQNFDDDDGCSHHCLVESGFLCAGVPSECVSSTPVCGNQNVDPGEECDDGNLTDGDGCGSDCTRPDGFFDDFESGDLSSWKIGDFRAGTTTARVVKRAGSRVAYLFHSLYSETTLSHQFEFDERIVFEFDMEAVAEASDTEIASRYGSSGVHIHFLGHRGATLGSVSYVKATTSFPFEAQNQSPTKVAHEITRDGMQRYSLALAQVLEEVAIDPAEVTDVELNYRSYSSTHPLPSVTARTWIDNVVVVFPSGASCGNEAIDEGERCDDGNRDPGDGCSERCLVERGFSCAGEPSQCGEAGPLCGDGVLGPDESCDDGNRADNDGCEFDCARPVGFVDEFETGLLDQWEIGGRRFSANSVSVVEEAGSRAAQISQNGFSETTLSRTFNFDPALIINFEMKIDLTTYNKINNNSSYASGGADITLRDGAGSVLGSIWYRAATTGYPFVSRAATDSQRVNEVERLGWQRYALPVQELISQISVDPNAIATVELAFRSYASATYSSLLSATTWVDNVVVAVATLCADGEVQEGEACDDGNRDDGDGCSAHCEIENLPPDCSEAVASPDRLFPPDHKLTMVSIEGLTDPDGDPLSVRVAAIRQDEPLDDSGDGGTCSDAGGIGSDSATVRAERSGDGDGRVYHIHFEANDGRGGGCSGTVQACVPHDRRGPPGKCRDQGPLFDSTPPCGGGAAADGDGQEQPATIPRCGIGFELALLMPVLAWLNGRRQRLGRRIVSP